jgi:peptidoglycan/LPS O-acetylase OafA/YrhL
LLYFLVMGILMLPLLPDSRLAGVPPFPPNFPSWSLFSEVLANLLHGWFLRRRGWKVLVGVVAVSAAIVMYTMVRSGTTGGEILNETPWVARVMMSYTLGMLLFRLRATGRVRLKLPLAVVILLLIGVMAVRWVPSEVGYDMLVIFVLFPVILLAGAEAHLSARMVGVATVLGQASYAVYVLHVPVGSGMHLLWSGFLHRTMEHDAPWSGMVYVVVVFVLALVLDQVYDLPVRSWLQRRFVKK